MRTAGRARQGADLLHELANGSAAAHSRWTKGTHEGFCVANRAILTAYNDMLSSAPAVRGVSRDSFRRGQGARRPARSEALTGRARTAMCDGSERSAHGRDGASLLQDRGRDRHVELASRSAHACSMARLCPACLGQEFVPGLLIGSIVFWGDNCRRYLTCGENRLPPWQAKQGNKGPYPGQIVRRRQRPDPRLIACGPSVESLEWRQAYPPPEACTFLPVRPQAPSV